MIQYVYEKYGRDRAGMTAELITYRPRSAIRDIGKALGLSLDQVDRISGVLEHYSEDTTTLAGRFREVGVDPRSRIARQMRFLMHDLLGFRGICRSTSAEWCCHIGRCASLCRSRTPRCPTALSFSGTRMTSTNSGS